MSDKMAPDKILTRWGALKTERASWMTHWQEISTYLMPYQGRYFVSDRNRGGRRMNSIYDSTATRANRILASGLMSGATSPARPWFRLATSDDDLNTYQPVRIWLDDVAKLLLRIFAKSNTYRALHQMYEELGAFATGATILLPDYDNVIHHYPLTIGEYAIAADYKGNVCTIYREFEKQVSAVVKSFGYDNCSNAVKNLFDKGSLDSWIPLIHAIEPRADRDFSKRDNKNMPWASYYLEAGGNEGKFLRESGFPQFPALVPRWAVAGGDIYGNGPGMEALGDIKQLQHEQLRKAQGIDYQTNPPLQVPSHLKNSPIDRLPGGITYYDAASPTGGVRSMFETQLNLQHLGADIVDVRQRINSVFYTDLFLMLANSVDSRKTATEVALLQEEKLLMLGPTLERLHEDLFKPMVEMAFTQAKNANILPPPPDELRGMEIGIELISVLAQAQRAIGVNSVDRWIGSIGAVASYKPEVLDRLDVDYWVEDTADLLGVSAKYIVPRDKAEAKRRADAEAAQQMQQSALAEQQSNTARNLAQSPTDGDTALSGIMSAFTGYDAPTGA